MTFAGGGRAFHPKCEARADKLEPADAEALK
jgi:hypothetical protein